MGGTGDLGGRLIRDKLWFYAGLSRQDISAGLVGFAKAPGPDGVYLTSMKQDNQTVTLQGMAQSNERVSELLRNLGNNSPWLVKPSQPVQYRRD